MPYVCFCLIEPEQVHGCNLLEVLHREAAGVTAKASSALLRSWFCRAIDATMLKVKMLFYFLKLLCVIEHLIPLTAGFSSHVTALCIASWPPGCFMDCCWTSMANSSFKQQPQQRYLLRMTQRRCLRSTKKTWASWVESQQNNSTELS